MARRPIGPQEMADLSALFLDLAHNPKTRKMVAKAVKEVRPDRAGSFSDVTTEERFEALRAENEQREQMRQAREYQAALDAQRRNLIDGGRYTSEQADEIKKIIDRHGSTIDYDTAAVLYAHENPSVNPQIGPPEDQRPGATWEFPTVSGRDGKPIPFADFAKNPQAAAQNQAYMIIDDFKKRSVGSASRR